MASEGAAPQLAEQPEQAPEEPEIDPLDMYMVDVQKDLAKLVGTTTVSTVATSKTSKVVRAEGVAVSAKIPPFLLEQILNNLRSSRFQVLLPPDIILRTPSDLS